MWPGALPRPKLPTWDHSEWSNLNPDQCASWGPVVCGFAEMAAIGIEYKTWHYGSLSSPWGPYYKAASGVDGGGGGGGWWWCVHLRACTKSPGSRGITWITMGNVLRRDAGRRGPEGAEMQLWEDGWGQMNGIPHSECSHHHTGISLYLLLPPSLSLLLSGVPELPGLHSLEPDWRGSPLLLTGLIYLGYLWELGWKLPY